MMASKRLTDLIISTASIVLLSPVLLSIALLVRLGSRGPIIYRQIRVGQGEIDFTLFKFRTMFVNSDQKGLLTLGDRDSRITHLGFFVRKYKLDELPQLFNVLEGSMSLIGPRPEVRKYVSLYSEDQKKVLSVKPGLSDYASIIYRNETELLSKALDPEQFYIKEIMPQKLALNLEYIRRSSVKEDLVIMWKTLVAIFKH